MSESETVPILVDTSICVNEVNSALSDSSTEDIRLVPEVLFEPALDSPSVNRESQPLLGGLDVSFNQFPGNVNFNRILIRKYNLLNIQMTRCSVIWSGRLKLLLIMEYFLKEFHKDLVDHILLKILQV